MSKKLPKDIPLPDVNSLAELHKIGSAAMTSLGLFLAAQGLEEDAVEQVVMNMTNFNKYFGAQYAKLIADGKVPEKLRYRGGEMP